MKDKQKKPKKGQLRFDHINENNELTFINSKKKKVKVKVSTKRAYTVSKKKKK